MSDLNTATVSGRAWKDPEFRATPTGVSVLDVFIASNSQYKAAAKENTPARITERSIYMKVTLWSAQADYWVSRLHQGDYIMATGELVDDNFDLDDGGKTFGRLKLGEIKTFRVESQ